MHEHLLSKRPRERLQRAADARGAGAAGGGPELRGALGEAGVEVRREAVETGVLGQVGEALPEEAVLGVEGLEDEDGVAEDGGDAEGADDHQGAHEPALHVGLWRSSAAGETVVRGS